jgi:hypothetical protein
LTTLLPTERGVYTGKDKPNQYCVFTRITGGAVVRADDIQQVGQDTYRVTLYSKSDYEDMLQKIIGTLEAAGYYINSQDGENYETDTGYWQVPLTIQIIKE